MILGVSLPRQLGKLEVYTCLAPHSAEDAQGDRLVRQCSSQSTITDYISSLMTVLMHITAHCLKMLVDPAVKEKQKNTHSSQPGR